MERVAVQDPRHLLKYPKRHRAYELNVDDGHLIPSIFTLFVYSAFFTFFSIHTVIFRY